MFKLLSKINMTITGATNVKANTTKINSLLKEVGREMKKISSAFEEMCQQMKEKRVTELKIENDQLTKEVEELKTELRSLIIANGGNVSVYTSTLDSEPASSSTAVQKPTSSSEVEKPIIKSEQPKKVKEKKEKTAEPKPAAAPKQQEEEIHFGRLDIRVGKIINVEKHPDADSLYIEKVNVGDEKPRTIISGLVNHVPIEQMQDRIALFLCNLKPAKMRGVLSEGMIFCANDNGKVEILDLPEGCVPGDTVTVEGCDRKPDAQLNAKKKIWEQIQVDLKTNDDNVATYRGIPWNVAGRGPARSKTLPRAIIK